MGSTVTRPIQDPLAVVLLDNRLCMSTVRQNYESGKNILLNRFAHLNDKIEKSWLEQSMNTFKIKCKQLFLQTNWWTNTYYWVPSKAPTITANRCTLTISKSLDNHIKYNYSHLPSILSNTTIWSLMTNKRNSPLQICKIIYQCALLKII